MEKSVIINGSHTTIESGCTILIKSPDKKYQETLFQQPMLQKITANRLPNRNFSPPINCVQLTWLPTWWQARVVTQLAHIWPIRWEVQRRQQVAVVTRNYLKMLTCVESMLWAKRETSEDCSNHLKRHRVLIRIHTKLISRLEFPASTQHIRSQLPHHKNSCQRADR